MLKAGFFELQTPQDLFEKLQHDVARVREAPSDSYAAFDFVVTAWHLREWADRAGIPGPAPEDARHRVVLELCRQLCNGAKHFVMERKRPMGHTVATSESSPTVFETVLVVALSKDEAAVLGLGSVFYGHDGIAIPHLAQIVIEYWEHTLK